MTYTNGTVRPFARRERPSLLLDEKGFPLVMYNGIQGPNANYSCHSDNDRGCHCWVSLTRNLLLVVSKSATFFLTDCL